MTKPPEQLEREIMQLKESLFHSNRHAKHLEQILDSITSAKTFRAWQYYTGIRRTITDSLKRVLPQPLKKRIKKIVDTTIGAETHFFQIEPEIKKEWQLFSDTRNSAVADVFIFSIIAFDYRIQRPQHLALELAKQGHRVFYIENEFIPIPPKTPSNDYYPIKVIKYADNLYKVTLYASQNLFIYQDMPNIADKKIIRSSLKSLIREAHVVNPVAKIDHPFWSSITNEMAMPVIYDCMDEHGGFKETGKTNSSNEISLFNKSKLVLVSSDFLKRKAKEMGCKNTFLLKNAGEYTHFTAASGTALPVPYDVERIKKPIIGYYGAIADWFDHTCIEQVAKDFPHASIVLIGRVENNKIFKLASRYKNILLLGEKPYHELPGYLQQFDVCIIPFIINHLIKATSPVKVYEYMAAGKPVVATQIPELAPYKDAVYISKNASEFSASIRKALYESDDKKRKKRILYSLHNTWSHRGVSLSREIAKIIFPKVSIVLLSYNNPAVTERCIDSIFEKSNYPNIELIVVDNGSNPETVSVLNALAQKYTTGLKLILNKSNKGFSAGNNKGLAEATGDYMIVLNNDTVVFPGWISRLVYHASNGDVGLVGPITNIIGNEQKVELGTEVEILDYTAAHWGETHSLRNLAAFCWIMKRSLYKKIGGFDEKYGKALFEDDDYCMMVRKQGLKLLCADDVFIYHEGSKTVGSNQTVEYKKLFEKNKKYFEEKWGVNWVPHRYR